MGIRRGGNHTEEPALFLLSNPREYWKLSGCAETEETRVLFADEGYHEPCARTGARCHEDPSTC